MHVLDLSCCRLQPSRENVKLSSLRKLSLTDVYADDQVMGSLIFGCPLIEYLEIVGVSGLKV